MVSATQRAAARRKRRVDHDRVVALERACARRRVRELREPRNGQAAGARAKSGCARRSARTARPLLQYLAEAGVLTISRPPSRCSSVRLLTPVIRNSVGINLGVGLYGAGFWLFLAGVLVVVTAARRRLPPFVSARVPPIEALRIGRIESRTEVRDDGARGRAVRGREFPAHRRSRDVRAESELQRTGLGVDTDPMLVMANFPQYTGVDSKLLQDELRRIPQVTGVSAGVAVAVDAGRRLGPVGPTPEDNVVQTAAILNTVGYDYFKTLGYTLSAAASSAAIMARTRGHRGRRPATLERGDRRLARGELGISPPARPSSRTSISRAAVSARSAAVAQPLHVIGVVGNKPLRFAGAGAKSNLFFMSEIGTADAVVRLSESDVPGGLAAIDALVEAAVSEDLGLPEIHGRALRPELPELRARNQVSASLALVAVAIAIVGLFSMAVQVASRECTRSVSASPSARARDRSSGCARAVREARVDRELIAGPLAYFAAVQYLNPFSHPDQVTPAPFVASLVATSWSRAPS